MATLTAYPSSNAVVTTGWTNAANAYSDNAVYATAAPAKSATIESSFSGFDVSAIPAGSTINSVTITAEWTVSSTASIDTLGFEPFAGAVSLGAEFTVTTATIAVTAFSKTYTGITLADLAALRVEVRASRGSSNTAFTASMDYLRVAVDYTVQAAVVHVGSGSGSSVSGGSAAASVQTTASASGSSVSSGAAAGTIGVPATVYAASAAGGSTSSGSSGATVSIRVSAAGTGVTSGQASAARRIGLAAVGGSSTSGSAAAGRTVQISASGAAQSVGTAAGSMPTVMTTAAVGTFSTFGIAATEMQVTMYQFVPPTVSEVFVIDQATGLRIEVSSGITVLKEDGAYRQVRTPSQIECEAAEVVYLGGHVHTIDATEQAALTAAGYSAYITTA